jgi:hypothetical protein
MQDKLVEMRANRDGLRQGRDQWRSQAERLVMDQRDFGGGGRSAS